MFWVNTDSDIPIKSWCRIVEPSAMSQALNLAQHPVCVHHVALMPDCHMGMGMPIGGVIACKNAVIPNAVGVDIGCGMGFLATKIKVSDLRGVQTPNGELIHAMVAAITRTIPTGFSHHQAPETSFFLGNPPESVQNIPVVVEQLDRACYQIGTLGGGNHFLEIQEDGEGFLCLMLHSGSRNVGFRIAKHFSELAQTLCARWHSRIPPSKGEDNLAFLPLSSREGVEYLSAMQFALDFAKENRMLMMGRAKSIVFNMIKKYVGISVGVDFECNIHHNFAALENHSGENLWVHRKGATRAYLEEYGIIPGSMGTSSYIVRGLGNPESFMSCSHGAGRIMGRKEFCRTHSVADCNRQMAGIAFLGWGKNRKGGVDISEAPGAYKDIDDVVASETDLVAVVRKLKPIGVVKG